MTKNHSVENKTHLFQWSFNKYDFKDFIMSEKQVGQIISIVMRSTNGKDLISQSKFESSFMKMSFLKTYSHKRKNIKTFCSKKQKYLKRARRFK